MPQKKKKNLMMKENALAVCNVCQEKKEGSMKNVCKEMSTLAELAFNAKP